MNRTTPSFIQLILAISEIPQFFPYNFPWFQFLVGIPQVSLLWLYPHISPIPLVIRVSRLEVYMNCSCLFRCHVAVAELYISCCSRPKGWFLLRVMEVNWDWVSQVHQNNATSALDVFEEVMNIGRFFQGGVGGNLFCWLCFFAVKKVAYV